MRGTVLLSWTFLALASLAGHLADAEEPDDDVVLLDDALNSESKSANIVASGIPRRAYHHRHPHRPALISGFRPGTKNKK